MKGKATVRILKLTFGYRVHTQDRAFDRTLCDDTKLDEIVARETAGRGAAWSSIFAVADIDGDAITFLPDEQPVAWADAKVNPG